MGHGMETLVVLITQYVANRAGLLLEFFGLSGAIPDWQPDTGTGFIQP